MATDLSSTEIKSDSEPWSILENLVLAQAIYKCGDTNWVAIARTIKAHPQIHRTSSFFSQKSCAIQYTQLLENLEAENRRSKQQRGNEAGTSATQEIPSVVKLAGQLYHQRILEIKGLIRQDEERFRELVAELDEIRQGKWDSQLEQELKKNPPAADAETPSGATGDELSSVPTTSTLSSVSSAQPTVESNPNPDEVSETTTPAVATDKQEDTERSRDISVDEATTDSTPAIVAPETLESKAATEPEDVEMADAAELTSVSNTPAMSSTAPEAGDVEMDDVTTTASSDAQDVTPADNKEADESSASKSNEVSASKGDVAASTTKSTESESDLSPPDAMDEEDDTQNNALASESKSEKTAADESMDDIQTKTEEEEEQIVQSALRERAQSKEDNLENELEEAFEENSNIPKQEELENEEASKDVEAAKAVAKQESEDEGEISSAVEEEEDDENIEDDEGEEDEEGESKLKKRAGRKPQKITTNVPLKRKRRGGHRGDAEEGYNSSDSEALDSATTNMSDQLTRVQMVQMDDKKWKKILMMIWTDIANHRFGAVFMQPIKEHDAPGYYHMIKRPMDLKSIKERIRDGLIGNADEFHRDVLLMFMNALMYNGEDTEVYQMAQAMMSEVEFIIKNFKSSQSFAPGPVPPGVGGGPGSGNSSTTTTPTTKTAEGGATLASSSSAASGPGSSTSSRRRKSSGIEMTPTE
ncbi:bromodomain-containing protein 8 [Entomortierella parvispora]|uniref:Bromodomain-containing protein 8 n=1 Tax=Entomortierella parvispora TaxID=205924 RepID=A0A9P3LSU1_9FUNG|nr:bromodomain-containing protein 8 [Entomortierella parvispora]